MNENIEPMTIEEEEQLMASQYDYVGAPTEQDLQDYLTDNLMTKEEFLATKNN